MFAPLHPPFDESWKSKGSARAGSSSRGANLINTNTTTTTTKLLFALINTNTMITHGPEPAPLLEARI